MVVLCIGDLVEDVVADLDHGPRIGTDTPTHIRRRRGGSAANTAVAVVRAGGRAHFVGRIGADERGTRLVGELQAEGVTAFVERDGVTGTVIVLVADNERSFLTDRGSAAELASVDATARHDATWWHVPAYSLRPSPLADAIGAARRHDPHVRLSIDASSTATIEAFGAACFLELCVALGADVLFANEAEAAALGLLASAADCGIETVVIKRGPESTLVDEQNIRSSVEPQPIVGAFDPTGAGDAFAGGFIVASLRGARGADAARAGNDLARSVLLGPRRNW